MSTMFRYYFVVALSVVPFTPTGALAAQERFAIAQFDNGRGLKMVVVIGYRAADCRKLLSTFEASLKLDCPQCSRDYDACTADLGVYKPTWLNQSFPAPYLSAGTHRYIYSGISRSAAEAACRDSAARLTAVGREARCVTQ